MENRHPITETWSVSLPTGFNLKIDDEDLVFWKAGFTIYIAVWNNDKNESPDERMRWFKETISDQAFDLESSKQGDLLFVSYRLTEDKPTASFYCVVIGLEDQVEAAIYFDDESDIQLAKTIFLSFSEGES